MGKLHELLAVEGDLKARALSALAQIQALFADGSGKLKGELRTYQPLRDDGEPLEDEITTLGTTVPAELGNLRVPFAAWVDAVVQKEATNQGAKSDVVIDEVPLLEDLPATALLNLESKLASLRQVYAAIPVLDPSEQWQYDDGQERYVSQPRVTYRTQKIPKVIVKYEATPEHPAQTELIAEDVRMGTWTKIIHSGMVTQRQKREWLERIDALLRAVKQARQRANDAEVKTVMVADKIFEYIHK